MTRICIDARLQARISSNSVAVTQWIVQRYRDQIGLSAAVGTTLFSLLQSLLNEYTDEWLRVIEALTFGRKSFTTQSG